MLSFFVGIYTKICYTIKKYLGCVVMTKLEILDTFLDINEDACKAVYNNDLKEIDMLMNNIYSSSLLHEDDYRLVLQAFRLAHMPFSICGYNILPYEIRNAFWGDYKGYIEDLTIGIMDLNTFLNKYGYANEYEALNDSNNKRDRRASCRERV